ncbi:MAG TPA: GNAT family N-acetyltransferase, partial [Candidatus Tectomicrobia bacterium]|nr:GNAT family N-acetyltransferase [Candidatus Tectomicrobia bacterium]
MSVEVRACASAGDLRALIAPITHCFGRARVSDEQVERATRLLPPERAHAAWDGDRVVGGAGAFPLTLTVPGGRVPAA